MNDQTTRIRKEVTAPIPRYYPNIRMERQTKTTKNCNQDSLYTSLVLTWYSLKYNALPVHELANIVNQTGTGG